MKISYNWLKEYLDFNLSPGEAGDILTNVGLEVDEISKWESVKGGYEGLKIGVVKEVQKHSDADKLTITKVNIGDATDLQIICGAPNVAAGQKVIVATDGVMLYPFSGDPFKIRKTKIRGVESEGMICAEDEIGLSDDHGGIMVLPEDAEVGTLVKDFLKVETDFIFEIGLTPNRGDAMSQVGVARDLASYLKTNRNGNASLRFPDVSKFSVADHSMPIEVIVENTEACPRYSGVTISGIEVKESPEWLRNRIKAVGLRPINNIVDITNFVMYECGQPLHAFDADQISGKKIIVKTLAENSVFKTLDDKEIRLSANDLMICDAKEGLCIAGVYGGIKSGVKETTTAIFLESACFNPKFIRRTSTKHLLRTDAAIRFEKGTDPNNTVFALKRASVLICETCGGKISSGIVDVYPMPVKEKIILLPWEKLNRVAGIEIQKDDARNILQALQFKILSEDPEQITVAAPTFKTDVTMAEDVIEEIIRINGIEKIPMPDAVRSSLSYSTDDKHEELQNVISETLVGFGFREMINNSVTNSKFHEEYFPDTKDEVVKLLSFSNAGLDSMRASMIFPALEVISYNHNRKMTDLKLFEFGKTYRKKEDRYDESSHLILLATGNKFSESWQAKEQPVDFYFLKGVVENILRRGGIRRYASAAISNSIWQTGLTYSLGKSPLVNLGKASSKIISSFDIKKEVWYADFDFDALAKFCRNSTTYAEPSKFPAVRRDLALVLDQKISFLEIESLAYNTSRGLLKEVNLFDVYQDEKIGADKKSYAVSFTFEDSEKTLTDKEVESNMEKLIRTFEKELGASIRQ
ncbi:MAG TPA: phenylalanine--tRNA ligase subunit beta [Chitinophagales bacterium]|nr:phenylalanine--tRNA ligase subunit beta [Chitinophagales bacterium]